MFNSTTEMNCIMEKNILYLKHWKEVTMLAFDSKNNSLKQEISGILEVKGAAMEASSKEREMPTEAAFKAPQSLAPSPHMQTVKFSSQKDSTKRVF
mmetsp:Transcript_21760/g.22660  ORF Transcript_21760/g.22660 Transcript_21760/m.22660 type:complete len:96 (+) Transcript_21760:830-1117(+)